MAIAFRCIETLLSTFYNAYTRFRIIHLEYIYIYIHTDENSAENSSFIANVRTAESAPLVTFSLNNAGLFRLNIHDE